MMTQRTLVADMIPWVASQVLDSGVCATSDTGKATIIRTLDLACDDLHKRLDAEGTLFEWYVPVTNGCFALPQECREARQIGVNGLPARQRSEFYIGKIYSGGCGEGCSAFECRDLGDFYIPQYLPKRKGIRIALVAHEDADAGKTAVVEILNEYGQPQRQTLTLLADQAPAIMDSMAYDVTFFKKQKTVGPVSLQLHYDDGQRFNFCQYLPKTQEGLFRRKQMPQRFCGCSIARILGKMRYFPITAEDEIMPFNDRIGMRWACAAIAAQERRDDETYNRLMLQALGAIKKQMEDADSASNVKQVLVRTNFANPSQAGGGRGWN